MLLHPWRNKGPTIFHSLRETHISVSLAASTFATAYPDNEGGTISEAQTPGDKVANDRKTWGRATVTQRQRVAFPGLVRCIALVSCTPSKQVHTTYAHGGFAELRFSELDATDIEATMASTRNSVRTVMPVALPKTALHNTVGIVEAALMTAEAKRFYYHGTLFTRLEITSSNTVAGLAKWLPGDTPKDKFYIVVCPVTLAVFFQDKVTSGRIDENTLQDLGQNYGEDVAAVWLAVADTSSDEATKFIMDNHSKLGTKFTKPDIGRRTSRIKLHRINPDYNNVTLNEEIGDLEKRIATLTATPQRRGKHTFQSVTSAS